MTCKEKFICSIYNLLSLKDSASEEYSNELIDKVIEAADLLIKELDKQDGTKE
jgi:hypothetical protein